jgi:hypothetical protein
MRSPVHHRKGFTILLAVVMFGLVAVAAAMIVRQLGYELQRTRTAYEDAQLRQLLLAGAQDVATHGDRYRQPEKTGSQKLDLPKSLAGNSASVSILPVTSGPSAGDVLIEAHFGTCEATEMLHLDSKSKQWRVADPGD